MQEQAIKHAVWTVITGLFHGLKYLLVLAVALAVVALVWAILDPPEPLRISPETTLITEPIAEDGLPDFAGAILDRLGPAVEAEENGAIEFWRAMGPQTIEPRHRKLLFDHLGCESPSTDRVLVDTQSQAIKREIGDRHFEGVDETAQASAVKYLHLSCTRMPSQVVSTIQFWLSSNEKPLDLLSEGIKKKCFYSPSPSLLEKPAPSLYTVLLPAEQGTGVAVRGLSTRAMTRLSSGDVEACLTDLEAVLGYAKWCDSGDFLVSQRVGHGHLDIGLQGLASCLSNKPTDEQALAVLRLLADYPEPTGVRDALQFGEAVSFLDAVIRVYVPIRMGRDGDFWIRFGYFRGLYNANAILLRCHSWQREAGEIAAVPNRIQRRELWGDYSAKLRTLNDATEAKLDHGVARDEKSQSTFHADNMICKLIPDAGSMFVAEDRCVAQHRMTRIAAALKLHQLRHGEYPDSLDALAPELLAEIPLDPFTDKPFVYERRDEGFAIWSLGRNGVDDGGSDQTGEFVDGDYAPIDWTGERPRPDGPDDIVVRLPVPAFELPGVLE